MLKSPERQASFYDTEYICESLILPGSFYRKFREAVWPLVQDEDFESMYCEDNGRPPISPALLAKAMILQFHRGLSDREMERACMYDIEIKYALGLKLDERPFDHSSLGDFRKRLLKSGKEKAVFDRILSHLVQSGLIEENESQRIDATHIIADIAIPTMVTLVKKGVHEVLKPLKKHHPELYQRTVQEIHLSEYDKEALNQDMPGRMDMEAKKAKLVEVVSDARRVLQTTETLETSPFLSKRRELLKRILRENIEEGKGGDPKEIAYKEKPKNLLVTPIDEDARYGAKSDTKRFVGYKANVTETVKSRFITNIKAMRGNRRDGDTAVELVTEQNGNGLTPEKLIGDSAYSDGSYRKALKENHTHLVAPLRERNTRTKLVYPKRMFRYDAKAQSVTCPKGVTTKESFYDKAKEIRMFHFPRSACGPCEVRTQCTRAKEERRTIGISQVHQDLREAETYNLTERFKEDMKLRPAIEGKLSELTRYHGLRRARYRGLQKMGLQCYFTATAVNIKRWFRILMEKIKPDRRLSPAF